MRTGKIRDLDPGYASEVDCVDEHTWCRSLQEFDDANIYQTWPYGVVTSGRRNMSHAILRKHGDIVAMTQARIATVPLVNVGIAYVRWGPLWRHRTTDPDPQIFRQAIRALRNEFAVKRGWVLRLYPALFDTDSPDLSAILAEEGLAALGEHTGSRTILMDLRPALEELREGMRPHWKRELKLAERNGLSVVEGSDDDLFAALVDIHREMVSRKKFVVSNDINQFRRVQAQLPERFKMKIMLCRSGAGLCAGLACSAIGKTAVYLFGATSNVGMKSNGSYLLQWKLIEQLKAEGCTTYDLNGINPVRNPGTYKFKDDLGGRNGRDVHFLGRFDSRGGLISSSCIAVGDRLLTAYRTLKELTNAGLVAAHRE